MTVSANRTLAGNDWVLRVLVATALLQAWALCTGMCGVVFLFVATHSVAVHDALGVVTALAEACVRIALHALMGS